MALGNCESQNISSILTLERGGDWKIETPDNLAVIGGFLFWGKMKYISIKFNNWQKYQKRSDYKNNLWWFALKNDFYLDEGISRMSIGEKYCFVCLLGLAMKQAKEGVVFVKTSAFSGLIGARSSLIKSTVEKLFLYGICTESVHTLQNITLHNKTLLKKEKIYKKEKDAPASSGDQDTPESRLDYLKNLKSEMGLK